MPRLTKKQYEEAKSSKSAKSRAAQITSIADDLLRTMPDRWHSGMEKAMKKYRRK